MALTAADADRIQQKYLAAYREIARQREGSWIRVSAHGTSLDLIVTGVHAGDTADIRQAYLTGRLVGMPVKVTVDAHNLAWGFYRLQDLEAPAA
jgi:hypothetical protein